MNQQEQKIKERFILDTNIPIQVFHSPYFEERLDLFNKKFKSKEKWNDLQEKIKSDFNGDEGMFLNYYNQVRETIVKELSINNQYFDLLNKDDLNAKFGVKETFPERNLYTCEQVHKDNLFISIDLKKANYQALRFYDKNLVLNTDSYEELISKFTNLDYIINSKFTRQFIFGKINPRRTVFIEKYIINKIISLDCIQTRIIPYADIFSVNNDEVIFKVKKEYLSDIMDSKLLIEIQNEIKRVIDISVKIDRFQLKLHEFKLGFSDSLIRLFEKENFIDDLPNDWKNVPSTYYPQVYKIMNNIEITDNDLIFYDNHELVKFIKSLEKINHEHNTI